MDDYSGRVLADRYRLPLPPSDEYELTETRAFDTYSGQEVLLRQVPLPEVVEAEVLDADGLPDGFTARDGASWRGTARTGRTAGEARGARTASRRPADPAVRRAVEAAQASARIPDHPRLDQVFDVFAEGGSLWVVSELVAARPLAALLAEKPLTPYRAAEVASDILTALRVLHAHGWVHRNITARTVLVCDDGRVMLTGLAVGAAEEALCGYDPVPLEGTGGEDDPDGASGTPGGSTGRLGGTAGATDFGGFTEATGGFGGFGGGAGGFEGGRGTPPADPEAARRAAIEARAAGPLPGPDAGPGGPSTPARPTTQTGGDIRAARAGAIAAYRAGARAAARAQEAQQGARAELPGARTPVEGEPRAAGTATPPGRIADPYGVQAPTGNGITSQPGASTPLPPAPTDHPTRDNPGPYTARTTGPGATPTLGPGTTPGSTLAPGTAGAGPGSPAAGHGTPGGSRGTPGAGYVVPAQGRGELGAGAVEDARGVPARWGDLVAGGPARRGPATALAAERARQARMAVVGPVTERWAPEQAGPVHENWQLAAPIGPATDLWALGALLFRAVQGHAPYPEESTAELVQMVCAEPPAYAEECGPLRPVVESLLRQDPTDRLDFEELRGWLRSLVRSAPEPEAGAHVIAAPPADPSRLPVVRRRGELVRRRRAGLPAPHGRHKRQTGSPRRLGRTLLLLVLLLLAGAIAYAMLFMPKADRDGAAGGDRTGTAGEASPAPTRSGGDGGSGAPQPGQTSNATDNSPSKTAGSAEAEAQTTAPDVADGFTVRKDPAGFQVAVAKGWDRTPGNSQGQVIYSQSAFELIVVPGRDTAAEFGSDPMAYQREKERELQAYRDSSWATSSGLRTTQVGGRVMAEGQFTWTDASGRQLFVRNLATLIDGEYHVVQVRGPEAQRDRVTTLYEQASATYRYTG
ncbi:protein kinase [Streptomyces sp. NPDC001292]|uniref:protein kinase n=1 Tax=Streptomyces sp. NPDC001292 TaxID=3364558 RepID=UPI00369B3E92